MYTEIAISSIVVAEGRRTLRQDKVEELADSIRGPAGLLNAIQVVREGDGHRLVAGLHRLEACRSLGWKSIKAMVMTLSMAEAEMVEIDENVCRSELTALEFGEAMARRKELYEARFPEARSVNVKGGPGRGKKTAAGSAVVSAPSFAADAAARTGKSPRTILTDVQVGRDIAEDVRESIRNTPIAESKEECLALSRADHEEQRAAVKAVKSGRAESVRQALTVPEPVVEADDDSPAAHCRATKPEVRQRIVELYRGGANFDDILAMTGVHKHTVRKILKEDAPEQVANGRTRVVASQAAAVEKIAAALDALDVSSVVLNLDAMTDSVRLSLWEAWCRFSKGRLAQIARKAKPAKETANG